MSVTTVVVLVTLALPMWLGLSAQEVDMPPSESTRNSVITLRLTDREKQSYEDARASSKAESLSSWMRSVVSVYTESFLETSTWFSNGETVVFIKLDETSGKVFVSDGMAAFLLDEEAKAALRPEFIGRYIDDDFLKNYNGLGVIRKGDDMIVEVQRPITGGALSSSIPFQEAIPARQMLIDSHPAYIYFNNKHLAAFTSDHGTHYIQSRYTSLLKQFYSRKIEYRATSGAILAYDINGNLLAYMMKYKM